MTTAPRENFPVALAVLPPRVRRHLVAVYRFARHVDDLGDEAPVDRIAALAEVEQDVHHLYTGGIVHERAVAGLRRTIEECGIPASALRRLVQANQQDQQVCGYETFDDLLGYCRLSAEPVGEMVLHVFGSATRERVILSNRVCTGLQLVEHWQDIAEDRRNGRVYLPREDMRRFGVSEHDLDGPVASAALRELVAFQTHRALTYLDAGTALITTLHGWARLAVSGYVAGGRAAAGGLADAGYDPIGGVPKPGRRRLLAAWARQSVRSRA